MPLHEACLEGRTRMVLLLLALGADVNAKTGVGVLTSTKCKWLGVTGDWLTARLVNCRKCGRL